VASLVERFGLDNVQRVLETRRLASAQYNDQYNGDDNDYDDEDGDDDENEDDLYVRAASQAVEPLQRRSASTGVSSITYNSGQGTNHSSNSNSNSGKSGRRTSGSAGSGSNDNSSSHSHLSNELRVGDLVQWCQSDEDLPEGVVGEVTVVFQWWRVVLVVCYCALLCSSLLNYYTIPARAWFHSTCGNHFLFLHEVNSIR